MAEDWLTGFETSLRRRVADLEGVGSPFALVGGLAVSTRAEPRLTRDVDFAVSVTGDVQAEDVIRRLTVDGYIPGTLVEQETTGRLATVRLTHEQQPGMVTDLLFASSGIESEIVEAATDLEVLPDFVIPVATTGHLIAMKLLARDDRRRPADADDLGALMEVATDGDWEVAAVAVTLIVERGYARGRDLPAALGDLRRSGPFA